MAWQNKILRVNLSDHSCISEPLNRDWAQAYLGQRGLGSKYLVEEVDPGIDPLSPQNKLIIATGPLTATTAPTGGRSSAVTKGALTGAIAASNTGGMFGAELKLAGYDLLIIEGRAASPVYLWICDDHAELRSAEGLWGRSVWETEPWLRRELGEPQAKIASIGRAGEVGVKFACIVNDIDRAYGRSGVGTVMGSKQLKAIAVRGTRGVRVDDPLAFQQAVLDTMQVLQPSPVRKRFTVRGTHNMMDVTNRFGSLPTRNCRDVQFEGVEAINADAVRVRRLSDGKPSLQGNKACFACTIGCGRVATIDPVSPLVNGSDPQGGDRSRYKLPSGGLEYETAFAFGPMCGVDDLDTLNYVNFLCNEQGMDPISLGVSIAAAMELFEENVLTLEDTGGLELRFGNAEALARVAELTAFGEDFGADIGLGAARLCQKYGRPELAMVVKGQEFPGYDPRALKGMALAYATSNRGCCHMRARPLLDDFSNVSTDGKAELVKTTQDLVGAIDSSGTCVFTNVMFPPKHLAQMIDAACEGDWDLERLHTVGERIWNLERRFNLAAGFSKDDDRLPKRTTTEPAGTGAGKGQTADLSNMLGEYYRLRGWDAEGVPLPETLDRLEL
ncbi:MAG: aldehyde ferredoxin oxidoreductase family protein [Gammaproteobacteria bacterium]|nr:aldehyde ferredoxin oxidoreductase family protein [Gammaproteobacteria bacterium]MDH3535941.1 aldehyde ferredoxin oxidoreductase family protein [Gammaproteobacteria bacterium]